MPITRSAKKALRQSKRRRVQNLKRKETYKQVLKETRKRIAEGKTADAQSLIPRLYQALDKAAKTNVIKPRKAARLKSRILKSLRPRTS